MTVVRAAGTPSEQTLTWSGLHQLLRPLMAYADALTRYLRGTPVVLVTLVYRDQGLIVPPGNPKGIASIEDLTRPEVQFVNRQRGRNAKGRTR